MTVQDDYNAAQAAVDGGTAAHIDAAKAAYQALKNCGHVGPAKLIAAKVAFDTLVGVSNWLCERLNDCAADVPGVQPLSAPGPKRSDTVDAP